MGFDSHLIEVVISSFGPSYASTTNLFVLQFEDLSPAISKKKKGESSCHSSH